MGTSLFDMQDPNEQYDTEQGGAQEQMAPPGQNPQQPMVVNGAQLPGAQPKPSFGSRILNGLFHVPTAYEGLLAPEDIRAARGATMMQLGSALMGGGLPPGSHDTVGGAIARTLGQVAPAWQGNLQHGVQAVGQGLGLGQMVQRMHLQQVLASMHPPADGDHTAAYQYYMARANLRGSMGDSPGQQAEIHAANVERLMMQAQDGGAAADGVAPPAWFATWKQANPEPPTSDTGKHVLWQHKQAQALNEGGFYKSAVQQRGIADAEQRGVQFTTGQENTMERYSGTRTDKQEQGFLARADIKPIMAAAPTLQQAFDVLHQAEDKNPEAYKSTIMNFAQNVDQKAQLRIQMFSQIEQLDPSMRGRFRIAFQRLLDGTIPPQDLGNLRTMLTQIANGKMQSYEQARQDYIKAHPLTSGKLTPGNRLFWFMDSSNGQQPNAAAVAIPGMPH